MEVFLTLVACTVLAASTQGKPELPVVVHVDMIEEMHVIEYGFSEATNRWTFTDSCQCWNLWNFHPVDGQYHIRDWRACKASDKIWYEDGRWNLSVIGTSGKLYLIRARVCRVTKTLVDTEVEDGKVFDEKRRKLIHGFRK